MEAAVESEPARSAVQVSLASACERVDDWFERAADAADARVTDANEHVAEANAALVQAEQALTLAKQALSRAAAERAALDAEYAERKRRAVLDTLATDALALEDRARLVLTADAQRRDRRRAMAEADPEFCTLRDEVQAASALDLSTLPASYRGAVQAHHAEQAIKLAAKLRAIDPGPIVVDAPWLSVNVVWDARDVSGGSELRVWLPVRRELLDVSQPRGLDIALHLAARVAESLYRQLQVLGYPEVRIVRSSLDTALLAFAVGLPCPASRLTEGLAERLMDVADAAGELVDARVRLGVDGIGGVLPDGPRGLDAPEDDDRILTDEIVLEVEDD